MTTLLEFTMFITLKQILFAAVIKDVYVSNKFFTGNPKAFLTHFFGHALKLAVVGMVKNMLCFKDSMETTYKF